jgi:arginase
VSETLAHLDACDIIYVSFDIDSIDGRIVHGTGTPVKDGLSQFQAEYLLKQLYASEKVVAIELVEVNPLLDDDRGNIID